MIEVWYNPYWDSVFLRFIEYDEYPIKVYCPDGVDESWCWEPAHDSTYLGEL